MFKYKKIFLIITFGVFLIVMHKLEAKPIESNGNLGVHWFQAKEIAFTDFDITYVRQAIPWGMIEAEEGKFTWGDQKRMMSIEIAQEKGIKFIPVIRAVGADWALKPSSRRVDPRPGHQYSSPPKDLEDKFNKAYGYSKSYYNFVKEVAHHYKGKCPIVVIENEVTAKNFWSGTMDEYLRLVATAGKAFKDVDPDVKIADSGIPSTLWGYLMVKDIFRQGKPEQAFDFYKAYFKDSFVRQVNSIQELKIALEKQREAIENAEYLLERLNKVVDIVNFHYYESPEILPKLIAFIKKETGDLPLMNNELGARAKLDYPDREKKASEDMIKKFTLSLVSNLEAAIWFPFTNDRHNIVGLFDENKRKIEITTNTFTACMRFLNQSPISYQNLSSEGIERYSFTFSSEKVDVAWSAREKTINLTDGYLVFNFQGEEIKDKKIILSHSPVFIVSKIRE